MQKINDRIVDNENNINCNTILYDTDNVGWDDFSNLKAAYREDKIGVSGLIN